MILLFWGYDERCGGVTVCRRVVDYDWHTEQGGYRYVFLSELVISLPVLIMSHDSRPGLFYLFITRFMESTHPCFRGVLASYSAQFPGRYWS